jgi:toxin FitB
MSTDPILPFDKSSAHIYGQIMSKRKTLGRSMSILDGQIAAIAVTNELDIVTRNARDFIECGLSVLNPFE